MVLHKALCALGFSALILGMMAPAEARRVRGHAHQPRRAVERSAPASSADGLAASHEMRREGGRLCFADHTHYGSSSGESSLKAAQAQAANSWASFVDFEYGSTWASYAKASGKDMQCAQSGAGWGCNLGARPCR